MIITEKKNDGFIEVPALVIDKPFTVWDSKEKKYIEASYIKNTPFPWKNHTLIFSGMKGSGKTSTQISLISSKKYKVYYGCFDTIIYSCPESTFRSLKVNPFKDLEHIYHDFNEEFLERVLEIATENSGEGKDTLVAIDDQGDKLRSPRLSKALEGLCIKNRHLRLTIHIMIQDVMMLNPTIRSNVDGILKYKPINTKRDKIFHEEFFSQLTTDEFNKLNDFSFKDKGDFLYVDLTSNPRRYFKNFNEIFLTGLVNAYEEKQDDAPKGEKSVTKDGIEKKSDEAK